MTVYDVYCDADNDTFSGYLPDSIYNRGVHHCGYEGCCGEIDWFTEEENHFWDMTIEADEEIEDVAPLLWSMWEYPKGSGSWHLAVGKMNWTYSSKPVSYDEGKAIMEMMTPEDFHNHKD